MFSSVCLQASPRFGCYSIIWLANHADLMITKGKTPLGFFSLQLRSEVGFVISVNNRINVLKLQVPPPNSLYTSE